MSSCSYAGDRPASAVPEPGGLLFGGVRCAGCLSLRHNNLTQIGCLGRPKIGVEGLDHQQEQENIRDRYKPSTREKEFQKFNAREKAGLVGMPHGALIFGSTMGIRGKKDKGTKVILRLPT